MSPSPKTNRRLGALREAPAVLPGAQPPERLLLPLLVALAEPPVERAGLMTGDGETSCSWAGAPPFVGQRFYLCLGCDRMPAAKREARPTPVVGQRF